MKQIATWFLIGICVLSASTKDIIADEVPPNASVYGSGWTCDYGYRRVGNGCQRTEVPPNASVYGSGWTCDYGYRRVGNGCQRIEVPSNAFAYGSGWTCDYGYRRVGNGCQRIEVPPNAFAYGSGWTCDIGYKKSGDKCIAMISEEKRLQLLQILMQAEQAKKQTIRYDDYEFTLNDVERKCEVHRYSEKYGKFECRSDSRIVERECEVHFSEKADKSGDIDCSSSVLRPLEKYCTVKMYSENYGGINCE